MKFRVITIEGFEPSEKVAERCIRSAEVGGIEVKKHRATIPDDNPLEILKRKGIPSKGFQEVWSRTDRCMSAFLSHHSLWEKCVEENVPYCIFEHDAFVADHIPTTITYKGLLSLGHPSYGKFKTPKTFGVNPLTSKKYLPGAHAYMIKPAAAKALIERARIDAGPTDVFLHIDRFPWIEEYYPWPVVVKESFTTIQRVEGTKAKHIDHKEYKIL